MTEMAFDPERSDWHVIVQAHNGTVSILKNLTLHTALETRKRIHPYAVWGDMGLRYVDGAAARAVWVIGPEGWKEEYPREDTILNVAS